MNKGNQWICFNEKFKQLRIALKLQAKEYKRRLEDLNGEGKRIKKVQKDSIPREVFDRIIDQLRIDIKILSDWKTKQEGKSQLLQYIPWLLTAISLTIMYMGYKK